MAVILTEDELADLIKDYSGHPFAFDIETMGENRDNPLVSHVTVLSLANDDRADAIPMGFPHGELISERLAPNKKGRERMDRGVPYEDLNPKYDLSVEMQRFFEPAPKQLERGLVMDALEPLFLSDVEKRGHNIKFDLHGMNKYFVGGVEGPFFDTMIASWLFDSRRVRGKNVRGVGGLSLEDCVYRTFNTRMKKGVGKRIEDHAFSVVMEYAELDAVWAYDLAERLKHQFTPQMQWLMNLEMWNLNPILEMESAGVQIDLDVLRDLDIELRDIAQDAENRAHRAAGRKFNVRSNRDKQEVLFLPKKDLGQGIRSAKLTPGGKAKRDEDELITVYDKAVDSEVLEAHKTNPVCAALIEYAEVAKIHGTYVVPYVGGTPIGQKKHKTSQLRGGRIYGQFKQSGTESGRYSSSNPNLQNIPSRSALGRRIREAFVANTGELLVVADYSQIEPRIIASLSGDPTMIQAYKDGGDVYQVVADRMGVSRQWGKTLVLAIAYGVGVQKISSDIGCSEGAAQSLMSYFAREFPKIGQHKKNVITASRNRGYSETMFGRRRYLPDLKSNDKGLRAGAERQAYNHLIQGSAADIMKIALVNVHAALPESATMLMTVHDEIVITAPQTMVEDIENIVVAEMEGSRPSWVRVPLKVGVQSGLRWADCK